MSHGLSLAQEQTQGSRQAGRDSRIRIKSKLNFLSPSDVFWVTDLEEGKRGIFLVTF
jgi:hypothetical protein